MKKLLTFICISLFVLCGCSKGLSYEDLQGDYILSSGVGAWSTSLTINEDGSFSGSFKDSDMGSIDTDYPNGTIYYCNFSGSFDSIKDVDDTTYTMTLKELNTDNKGTYIEDGVQYIESSAYGLADADKFIVYTEDTKYSDLSEGAQFYINAESEETLDTIGNICIYNEAQDLLFIKQD